MVKKKKNIVWIVIVIIVFAYFAKQKGFIGAITPLGDEVAYYSFDTDASDDSGNGLDGSLVGTPTQVAGYSGNAYRFDGTDGISVADNALLDFTTALSYSFWINMDSLSQGYIISKSTSAYGIQYYPDDDVFESTMGSWTPTTTYGPVSTGTWYHIVFTYDSTLSSDRAKMYVNNALVSTSDDFTGTIPTNTNPLMIGNNEGGTRTLMGTIDDVRLFDRALTANEVNTLYTGEPVSYCGDGTCDAGEDCSNCEVDCGVCGNVNFRTTDLDYGTQSSIAYTNVCEQTLDAYEYGSTTGAGGGSCSQYGNLILDNLPGDINGGENVGLYTSFDTNFDLLVCQNNVGAGWDGTYYNSDATPNIDTSPTSINPSMEVSCEELVCGNGICEVGETTSGCPADCPDITLVLQVEPSSAQAAEPVYVDMYITNDAPITRDLFIELVANNVLVYENSFLSVGTDITESGTADTLMPNKDLNLTLSGGFIEGEKFIETSVKFTVIYIEGEPVCGDGICEAGENCQQDASYCTDNTCYEPTCVNGCGQTPIVNGGNDEGCISPNYCDGAGTCVSGQDCSALRDALGTAINEWVSCVG